MARRLWLGLELLDHQIVDRHGRNAGNVDDLELEPVDGDDGGAGDLRVAALLSGPGLLAQRLGRRSIGRWLQRMSRVTTPGTDEPGIVPFARVTEIGAKVKVDLDASELTSFATERWVQDHVIGHIPGSRHEVD